MPEIIQKTGAAESSSEVLAGCQVRLRDDVVSGFSASDYRLFADRIGTVESVFMAIGTTRPTARVRWHKRGNRGKEFVECHRASDLERVAETSNGKDI